MKGAASKVPSRPPPLLVLPFQVGFRGPYAPTGGGGDLVFWSHGEAPRGLLGGRKDTGTTASSGHANITPSFRRRFN